MKKMSVGIALCLSIVIGTVIITTEFSEKGNSDLAIEPKNVEAESDATNASKPSNWDIPGLEKVKSKAPFKVKLPDPALIPENLKENSRTEFSEKKIGKDNAKKLPYVSTSFGSSKQNIIISQTIETGKPPFLNKLSTKKIDNITVYVDKFGDSKLKVYFWVDGMYYLVKGENITETKIDNIIKSMLKN